MPPPECYHESLGLSGAVSAPARCWAARTLVVPFDKVYAVAGGIGKIRDVAAPNWLRLVSSNRAIEATACGERSLKNLVKIADYEIEVDRRPVAAVVTSDSALRSSSELVDPEGLSV